MQTGDLLDTSNLKALAVVRSISRPQTIAIVEHLEELLLSIMPRVITIYLANYLLLILLLVLLHSFLLLLLHDLRDHALL